MAIPSGGATLAFSIGLNLTDYFVDVNRTEIAKLNGGQDFLNSWDVFYGAADFAIGMLNVNGVLKPKLDKTIVNKPGFSDKFRVFLSSTKGMLNYSSIKLLEFNNFMKYALAQKTFNEGLTVLANGFTKDLTGNFVACALYANTRYSIATLEYLENIGEFAYHFSPGKIITISETIANDYEKIANSKNTYYFNRAGEYVKGEFNVLRKIETGEIFIEEVNTVGNFASHVDIQASLSTILNLKNANKLTNPIGSASNIELAAIHRYTENGGVLNSPMRNGSETVLGPVTFTEFESQVYQHTISGLVKLRQTNRLVTSTVIRGRTYSLADYNVLFNSGSTNVPLKGMVSCTKNEAVAIDFLSKTGGNISGDKVKVIMKIKSKNGVDIDDISDYGVNLQPSRHPTDLIQEEVLMEEGMFKQIGQPKRILNPDGSYKIDADGTPWYEVELEELGTPLRTIN